MIKAFTDISLDLESPIHSPFHINSRLRLQLNAHNQELSVGTANTLVSRGPSLVFSKYFWSGPHLFSFKQYDGALSFVCHLTLRGAAVVSISLGDAVFLVSVTSSVIISSSLGQTSFVSYLRRENESLLVVCLSFTEDTALRIQFW